jgi:cytosine permease
VRKVASLLAEALSGFVLVISSFLIGGIVGQQVPLKLAIPAILFGVANFTMVAILIGAIGARTGYSSALIYRFSYGRTGVLLPSIVMAFTGIGWFALILNITRDAFVGLVGIEVGSIGYWVVTLVMALLFGLPAYRSIRWIAYVDWVAVPAVVLILLFVFYRTLVDAGGLWNNWFDPKVTLLTAFTIAAGGWLQGATVIADFARFIRNARRSTSLMLLTFGLLALIQFIGGALGAAATGDWNIFGVLGAFGVLGIGFIGAFFGAWSTTQAALYGSGLMMSAPPVPMYKNQETTRKLVVALLWLVAVIGAIFGLDQVVNWWVQFLAWIVAPIAVTVILDYWAFRPRRRLYESGQNPDMAINPAAYLAWIVGFLIGLWTANIGWGSSVVNSLVASGLLYYVWMRIALSRGTTPERQLFGKRGD